MKLSTWYLGQWCMLHRHGRKVFAVRFKAAQFCWRQIFSKTAKISHHFCTFSQKFSQSSRNLNRRFAHGCVFANGNFYVFMLELLFVSASPTRWCWRTLSSWATRSTSLTSGHSPSIWCPNPEFSSLQKPWCVAHRWKELEYFYCFSCFFRRFYLSNILLSHFVFEDFCLIT